MLSPQRLNDIPLPIEQLYRRIEDDTLEMIAASMKDGLSASGGYQIDSLLRMNTDAETINKELSKKTGKSVKEIEKIIEQGVKESYITEQKIYKKGGKKLKSLTDNPVATSFLKAGLVNAKDGIKNMSGTYGVSTNTGFNNMIDYYVNTVDYAIHKMGTGAFTYEQVLKETMRDLAHSGIKSINYDSGYALGMDSAARMHVRTGLSQITGNISLANADMLQQDLMEITAHADSRPSHASWQGQIVSLSGARGYLSLSDIDFEGVAGFKGANCRHDWYPYFEGISVSAYTDEDIAAPDEIVTEWRGKALTAYDVSQKQRQIERRIRQTTKEVTVYNGAGLDDDLEFAKIKLQRQRQLYREFSKQAGIRTKFERI